MPTKAKPIVRQQLEKLLVTDADAFTALRYLRHRESVPTLPDLEEKGASQFPGIEGSLCDLYHALWSPEPGMKEEVAPDRRYWQQLLGETLKSSAYEELHAATELSELKSVLGTISMGESVLGLVSKEDQQKLQEIAEAQQDANEMDEQAQQAEAQANAFQQLAQAGQGQPDSGQSQPQDGQPQGQPSGGTGQMSLEQAQQLANEFAKQAAEAKANAETARELAQEAKTKAEQLANDLLGKPGSEQAEQKLRELTRIGLQAAHDANAKVEEVSDTIEAWGLEEAELYRQGIPETMGLLERMKRNAALKKFAGLLGRIRRIAARKAKAKVAGEGARITVPETGRDIKRAQRSELMALVNPALRAKALQRWAHGELRLHGQKTKQKLGHGPVIVCEDGSGSMDGAKQQWAKAMTLSLAHYAKLQKRSFGWVLFDSGVRQSKVYPQGQIGAEQMLELVESRAGGGTDFERPLRKAIEMIQKEGLKKADVCFITDGECAVSDQFLRELKQIKQTLDINIMTVLCDVGSSADATVRQFSDRIEKVSAFTAEEAEQKIFAYL